MANLTAVTNGNTSVILEMATGVNEDMFSEMNVFAEISIEWRKDM